jgi:RNA-directed DNA polymerase
MNPYGSTMSMHAHGKSDGLVVPRKPANKSPGAPGGAERVEGSGPAKGNSGQVARDRTQRRRTLNARLDRVREAVARDPKQRLTALWHHVYDVDRLQEAYLSLKRASAAGADGVTWQGYGKDLEANLLDLSSRLRRGAYRAKPVLRTWIPKPDGGERPIGVPVLEDKIVQRATAEVLGAVYEADFLGFSYGFRPGRSQQNALDAVAVGIERRRVSWVLDADIRGFFDGLDHGWLVKFIGHRIVDERVIRHVKKWLAAGVLEEGQRQQTERGTPQGGSISPLLANIFLHYVFDLWAHRWRRTQTSRDVILVRYADDIIAGFELREDAERFQQALVERLREFGLELNLEKTRLIEFGQHAAARRARRGAGKPETFDFLGMTHICGKTRRGRFVVIRHTMRSRMRSRLREVKAELRRRMHHPVPEVGAWLGAVIRGYFEYHAVPFNIASLRSFRDAVIRLWQRTLSRRSQRGRVTWDRMAPLVQRWLPKAQILHAYPSDRLRV